MPHQVPFSLANLSILDCAVISAPNNWHASFGGALRSLAALIAEAFFSASSRSLKNSCTQGGACCADGCDCCGDGCDCCGDGCHCCGDGCDCCGDGCDCCGDSCEGCHGCCACAPPHSANPRLNVVRRHLIDT